MPVIYCNLKVHFVTVMSGYKCNHKNGYRANLQARKMTVLKSVIKNIQDCNKMILQCFHFQNKYFQIVRFYCTFLLKKVNNKLQMCL